MEKIKENIFSKKILKILVGSVSAIIISLILLLIFAILLTYTSISENTIKPVIIIISGVSILIGSSISSFKIKKNGMLNGGIVGIIYILSIYFISSITGTGFKMNLYTIIMILISIILGVIGGIVGVNFK